jgi:hypothetical protein
MRAMRFLLCVAFVVGCHTPAAVGVTSSRITVEPDSAARCSSMCSSVGMTLDSLVIMVNNVGCVCRAAPPAGATPPSAGAAAGASASAGGMAAVMIADQAAKAARVQSSNKKP